MCTRLVKNITVRKRWFMIFERKLPYELVFTLQKATPKKTLLPIFISNGSMLFVPTNEFTKKGTLRFTSRKEAETYKNTIINETYCIKCNHPRDCTKRMFRKWD